MVVQYTDKVSENLKEVAELRGISIDTLKDTGLLYFKKKDDLKEFLSLNPDFKKYLGWLHKKKGNFIGKYIVPSYLSDSSIFFYIIYNPKSDMKYLNVYLGDTVDNVYNKKTKVYGLEKLDYTKDNVYVVEGVFDRIRLVEEGYNVISLLGTSLSDYQLSILKRFDNIYLTMDSDNAGDNAIKNAKSKLLKSNFTGIIKEREDFFGTKDNRVKDVDDLFKLGYNEIKYK